MSTAESSRFPDPPYSPELLADLDADHFAPDVAAHIRDRITDDPDAQRTLAALGRVRTELTAPIVVETPPDWVNDRTQHTLAAIRQDLSRTGGSPRRRPVRRFTALLAAAAALVVAVTVAALVLFASGARDVAPSMHAHPSTAVPPQATPVDVTAALSVLGRTDGAPFSSTAALRRCTAANDISADTPVLGSGPVQLDGSADAVILLGTGVAGRFLALVVGRDCDTGNPATVSRTVIGG